MELGPNSYDITVERGCLQRADALLNLDRRVLIVTDRGVFSPFDLQRYFSSGGMGEYEMVV